jgi:hypothetical protein
MKKILFLACALLIGGFTAQAQEDSETVGFTTPVNTTTKVKVKKETKKVVQNADVTNTDGNTSRNADMSKVLEQRKAKSEKIKATKAEERRIAADKARKTGVTTSKARVLTEAERKAEEAEKKKKATKKDN